MRVTITKSAYNFRRYSRPWIAKITYKPNGEPEYMFEGYYNGTDQGGTLEISAEPGEIIGVGQKDFRSPKNTENNWYIVNTDGSLRGVDRAEAREHWIAQQNQAVTE